ncbi:MAG: formate/nitrite transporter family protein [Chromatiales bacterium]|jgi:formate/nitrite transporter FocA (FNT family)
MAALKHTQADEDQRPAAQKSYREILGEEIQAGLTELRRSGSGLWISAFSAGLDLGFSLLLMAVFMTAATGVLDAPFTELLVANAYTVGFIFVVLGRSELFTEHTTLAVLPVLNRRTTPLSLIRLWVIVYSGNLVGTGLFAVIAAKVGPALGVIDPEAFRVLGDRLLDVDAATTFQSAILAGWLMGLLSWLVTAARDTISQIVIIWLITASIGFAHLPHCIAGTTEVVAAMLSGHPAGAAEALSFLLWATLGNAFGGVFFVGVIKYAHVVRSESEP